MFSKARFDLRELVELTEKIASYDATLAANRSIVPEPSACLLYTSDAADE